MTVLEGCAPGESAAASGRRHWLAAMAAIGAVSARSTIAWAADRAAPSTGDWLLRIRDAALNRSYQGTATFSAGGVVSSSRIAHQCDGRECYDRVEGLDGRHRVQYRHNDQLVTLWPASRVAVVEAHAGLPDFPALPPDAGRAQGWYSFRHQGFERICGLQADVLRFDPQDPHRFAQQFWAERGSGLLLRADTLGPGGEVLETSAFAELSLGRGPDPESARAPLRRLQGWRVVRPSIVRTRLEDEGWTIARALHGFELLACLRRPLEPGGDDPSSVAPVVQAVFSDGLAQVSVFIEPFDPARHRPSSRVAGAVRTAANRRDDRWLTVVGEVPLSTVQWIEAALERRH